MSPASCGNLVTPRDLLPDLWSMWSMFYNIPSWRHTHRHTHTHTYKGIHHMQYFIHIVKLLHCTKLALLKGVGSMNFSVTCVGRAIPLFLLPLQICGLPSTTQSTSHFRLTQHCRGGSPHPVGEVDMYLWHTHYYTRSSSTLYTHTCHTSVEESVCSALHIRYWHTVRVLHTKAYTCIAYLHCVQQTNKHTLLLQYTSHLYLWMRCWVSS